MEGQGRLGTVAARDPGFSSGERRKVCVYWGLVPAFPEAGREGIKLRAALRRFPDVAPYKPNWAGVRKGQFSL